MVRKIWPYLPIRDFRNFHLHYRRLGALWQPAESTNNIVGQHKGQIFLTSVGLIKSPVRQIFLLIPYLICGALPLQALAQRLLYWTRSDVHSPEADQGTDEVNDNRPWDFSLGWSWLFCFSQEVLVRILGFLLAMPQMKFLSFIYKKPPHTVGEETSVVGTTISNFKMQFQHLNSQTGV